mgnify:CR=1 FL=1
MNDPIILFTIISSIIVLIVSIVLFYLYLKLDDEFKRYLP